MLEHGQWRWTNGARTWSAGGRFCCASRLPAACCRAEDWTGWFDERLAGLPRQEP